MVCTVFWGYSTTHPIMTATIRFGARVPKSTYSALYKPLLNFCTLGASVMIDGYVARREDITNTPFTVR